MKKGFSLVETLVVVAILAVLSGVAYVSIQRAQGQLKNQKMLDDLAGIANALEQYKQDHLGIYPNPPVGGSMNVLCYDAAATYAHDCDSAAFRQGMIDNELLTKRYLREVPTDPRTGSRYVYGVSADRKYFMVAGLFEESDGTWTARTADNLHKGYPLPSLIRAYDGSNFVTNRGGHLPYSPDHLQLTATLEDINGQVNVNGGPAYNGMILRQGFTITTPDDGASSAKLYFSDGSVVTLDAGSELTLQNLEVSKNDGEGTLTKILLKLNLGKIWNKVVRLADGSEFRVETTNAIAGVRGTEFSVQADDTIAVKSGDVWQVDGATNETVTDTQIESAPTITPTPEVYDEPATDTILLNNQVRPYVLSLVGDGTDNVTVVIDNVNRLVRSTADPNRVIPVTHIQLLQVTEEPGLIYTFSEIADKKFAISGTEPYTLTIPLAAALSNVAFKFVDETSGAESSPSWPPVTLSATANMTEADLNPVKEDKPKAVLTTPTTIALEDASFTADVYVGNYEYDNDNLPEFTIVSSGVAGGSPICTISSGNGTVGENGTKITVNVSGGGECALAISVNLPDGTHLTDSRTVIVREATAGTVVTNGTAPTVDFSFGTPSVGTLNGDILTIDPTTTVTTGNLSLTGTASDDGTIASYEWFENADNATLSGAANSQNTQLSFPIPVVTTTSQQSTYTVKLTVTDNDGNTAYKTKQLTVVREGLVPATLASITVSGPTSLAPGGSGTFSATGSYSDDTTQILTSCWSISPTSAGSISSSGSLAVGASYTGPITVQCTLGGISGEAQVEVTAPAPTISNLEIDCSVHSGFCLAGNTYAVAFNFENATNYSTQLNVISGSKNVGTIDVSTGSLSGNGSKTLNYTLGTTAPATVRLTVTTSGPGGEATQFIDIQYY